MRQFKKKKGWCSMGKGLLGLCVMMVTALLSGCALFHHEIIPQAERGPHAGAVIFIDKRIPEYVELVAIPGENTWTFQVFSYNKGMKPQTISGSASLEVELPDGEKKIVGLWSTKKFIWSRGIGYLENELELGDVQEFSATLALSRRKKRHKDYLKVSYADNVISFDEEREA